ncbi:MAG: hypothetical protein AAF959_09575 [Cyanobacteria bacterium P01_D01_bin.56]
MATQKPSDKLKPYKEKYQQQRSQFWEGLNQQLDRLQQAYAVAMTELAEGLHVSRQKLYDFKAAPEKGLPIDRADLMILWEWLTDPEALKHRRLSAETRQKREALRQEGPNPLLKAAGFLPIPNDVALQNSSARAPKIDSSLKRVEARLSSPWIEDGVRRSQIIDCLLDEVKKQGRLDKALHTEPLTAKDALTWLQKGPLDINEPTIIKPYQETIRRLVRAGKNQFVGVELFELYQNLFEYQSIDSYSGTKVDIIDCQFPILSAPLPASVQSTFEAFIPVYQQAELALLKLLCDPVGFAPEESSATVTSVSIFTPVIRALITSKVEGIQEPIVWRYSSTGTHLENMLAAITSGLGHSLEITGFSIQATGTTSRSLARVSVGLAERDNDGNLGRVYQGWWVDSNAITAVLVATIIATKDWLSNYGADLSEYFNICHQLGNIDNKLYYISENVQEYFFRATSGYSQNRIELQSEDVFDAIEIQIANIEKFLSLEAQTQPYYHTRYQALKNRKIKVKLARMRLALKNSSVEKVAQDVEAAKSFLTTYENANLSSEQDKSEEDAYRHILFLQASECVMLHNLYAGDKEFLNGKLWRYRARYEYQNGLQKLQKYVDFVNSLNFDTFAAAAQLFGALGLLELYMAEAKDADFLQEAAKHLLWAAHYSQRIGYVRRAAYWLTHASRVYCRLGYLGKSETLSQVAQVTADAVHQEHQEESEYDSKFKAFITATGYLAEGERLLTKGLFEKAIAAFLMALRIFIDIYSADRLTADTLYGLYRASCNAEGVIGNAFTHINSEHSRSGGGMATVLQDIVHELKDLDTETAWSGASPTFKKLAKTVWRHWATVSQGTSESHPIEEAMDRDRFLMPVALS